MGPGHRLLSYFHTLLGQFPGLIPWHPPTPQDQFVQSPLALPTARADSTWPDHGLEDDTATVTLRGPQADIGTLQLELYSITEGKASHPLTLQGLF